MKIFKYVDVESAEVYALLLVSQNIVYLLDSDDEIVSYDLDLFNKYFRKI